MILLILWKRFLSKTQKCRRTCFLRDILCPKLRHYMQMYLFLHNNISRLFKRKKQTCYIKFICSQIPNIFHKIALAVWSSGISVATEEFVRSNPARVSGGSFLFKKYFSQADSSPSKHDYKANLYVNVAGRAIYKRRSMYHKKFSCMWTIFYAPVDLFFEKNGQFSAFFEKIYKIK
jgi:hypothetical protein